MTCCRNKKEAVYLSNVKIAPLECGASSSYIFAIVEYSLFKLCLTWALVHEITSCLSIFYLSIYLSLMVVMVVVMVVLWWW
jgi:hypothetical protein